MTPGEKRKMAAMVAKIKDAQRALGRLSKGQLVDLLLDNFSWIADCEHARYLLAAIEDLHPGVFR